MDKNKYYQFETRSGQYHSGQFKNPAECKGAAFEVCKLKQENVILISMNDLIGHVYAEWNYNNGEPIYRKTHG